MDLSTFFFILVSLGIGVVLLLWGYRAFLAMLPVFAFFAGLWLGAQVISAIFGTGIFADLTGFFVGLAIGVVFAVLSYLFYALAIPAIAGVIGYGLGVGLMQALGLNNPWVGVLAGLIAAAAVIVLVLRFNLQKAVLIVLTAIAGANAIELALLVLVGQVTPDEVQSAGSAIQPVLQGSWFWWLGWLALAAWGIYYQFDTDKSYTFSGDEYEQGWGLPG